jgi:hypothetical protein
MKLVSKTVEAIITETFVLENGLGEKVTVIDYLDDRGKAIDTIVRDKNGNDIDDPILYENVISFLESIEESDI